ncbi:MAG: hypothetical protein M0P47_13005 [Bacteroidales bacterium]|nr:hypothetical protein [Bacteroidales bacterium]
MKTKLKATIRITQEYEADSKDYGNCDFVSDMIDIDKRNCLDDPIMFIDGMLEGGGKLEIEIVKTS